MKKRLVKSALTTMVLVGTGLVVGNAFAIPFGDGGAALQGVINNITVLPTPGTSSVNVATDYLLDGSDAYWEITASGGSIATMIIELGAYAPENIFGVYDGATQVALFTGSAVAGDQVTLSIKDASNVHGFGAVYINNTWAGVNFSGNHFGYYLDSSYYTPSGGLFFSDTAKNTDGMDHMVAYKGTGDRVDLPGVLAGEWTSQEYILAFEDLYGGYSDWNFTDMVVMVESVKPVPEPATMLLFGTGLIGLAGISRRKARKK